MTEEIRAPKRHVSPPRRVTAAFLERRWVSMLAELVLIVAGILIALYIDGWVQDQRDRESELEYLQRLSEDLVLNENMLRDYVDFESVNVENAVRAFNGIPAGDSELDATELQTLLSALAGRRTLMIDSAAFTDLTSTGNIRLIQNTELRSRIVRHFADMERIELVIEKNNSTFVDEIYFRFILRVGITPTAVETVSADVAAAEQILINKLGPDVSYPRDDVLLRSRASRSWDEIRRHVLLRARIASIGAYIGEQTINSSQELRAEIEKELERRERTR